MSQLQNDLEGFRIMRNHWDHLESIGLLVHLEASVIMGGHSSAHLGSSGIILDHLGTHVGSPGGNHLGGDI